MGRQIKETTTKIITLLETTNLTLEQIGKKHGKTKQDVSYIKKRYNVVRPSKTSGTENKELKKMTDLLIKEMERDDNQKKEIEVTKEVKNVKDVKAQMEKEEPFLEKEEHFVNLCDEVIDKNSSYCKTCFKSEQEYLDFKELMAFGQELYDKQRSMIKNDVEK